jgi:hypothetical protein
MKYRALVFISIGLAGAAIALLQPDAQNMQAQRDSIRSTMAEHGYVASRNVDFGPAVAVMRFSSSTCDNVRVLPLSVLFQESVLLKEVSNAGDSQTFVYWNERWKDSVASHVAVSHLSQQFLQMFRFAPAPAIDTMLYIVSPKKCGAALFDWSRFWASRA